MIDEVKTASPNGKPLTREEALAKHPNLSGANLSDAYLRRADLSRADLSRANLSGANLSGAYLRRADLSGANLSGANLSGANLSGAYLSGADLSGAKFDKATMPNGETWEQYLTEVVPSLLTAGGKPLAAVASKEHWECHDWTNCPMAAAFSVDSAEQVPPLYRPRAKEFVQFFDHGLIPLPKVEQPA